MTRPKLDKWYPLKTRFKVVPAHIKDKRDGEADNQYRLVIEFPIEHRRGWFPFELQLKDGQGSTNYWCNPFGEEEIRAVIEAVNSIEIHQRQLGKLWVVKSRYERRKFLQKMSNLPPFPEPKPNPTKSHVAEGRRA